MIVYEYPLFEQVRIFLRLEYLAQQYNELVTKGDTLSHHFAIKTLFNIADLCDAHTDLKSDVLRELERYRRTTLGYRDIPQIADLVESVLAEIDTCYRNYNAQMGKLSLEYSKNEWLSSVRSRINITAGACSFDHPSYYTWQHMPQAQRHEELSSWMQPLRPTLEAIRLLLRLLRDNADSQKIMVQEGVYQQTLSQQKKYQLVRISMEPNMQLLPEISASRLMMTIRLMRRDGNKLLHAGNVQAPLTLELCA